MVSTLALIEEYYKSLSERKEWQRTIEDDFIFRGVGGDHLKIQGTRGKQAYAEAIQRFYQTFDQVAIDDYIISDNAAYVTARYKLKNVKGGKMTFDIVERWEITEGKLSGLTIFFDTKTWNDFFST